MLINCPHCNGDIYEDESNTDFSDKSKNKVSITQLFCENCGKHFEIIIETLKFNMRNSNKINN